MKTALFIFLLLCSQAFADLIPTNRIYNWQPGVNCGVVGGIPTNRTMFTNIVTAGADPNGVTDASGIITTALKACPSGQFVYMPAGTYAIGSGIGGLGVNYNGVTLRGAGMGKTILKPTTIGGVGVITVGNSEFPRPTASLPVTNGATAGSTNLWVTNTSTVVVGRFVRLEQTDPNYVFEDQGGGFAPHSMYGLFYVTAKTSSNITVFPSLPCAFTNSPAIAVYPNYLVSGDGFEDFTVDMTNSTTPIAIWEETCFGNWIKNVEVKNSSAHQMEFFWCMNMEVRGCYTHDCQSSGPGHEGIDMVDNVCWSLIEDNICVKGGFPQIILGDSKGGCMGDVISYNYIANTDSGSSVAGGALSVNHGPHNAFNLVEGNVAQMFQSDGYFGSCSDITAYRNWFNGVYPGLDYPIVVNLDRWSDRFNIYGNVLGSNSYSALYDIETNGYANLPVVYRLGYPNMGNSSYDGTTNPPSTSIAALDLGVKNTILRTNNFDYATGGIVNPYTGTLPASLIYNSTPAWWPPGKRFPPIDTAVSPMTVNLPAQDRFSSLITPVRYFPWRR